MSRSYKTKKGISVIVSVFLTAALLLAGCGYKAPSGAGSGQNSAGSGINETGSGQGNTGTSSRTWKETTGSQDASVKEALSPEENTPAESAAEEAGGREETAEQKDTAEQEKAADREELADRTEAAESEAPEALEPEEANGREGEAEKPEEGKTSDAGLFSKLAEWRFEFCSGAGGWATEMFIHEDGSFDGMFYDGDMGSTGEGYEEHGTLYECVFNGHLEGAEEVAPYRYRVKIADISYENEPGKEKIADGTRYIYTTPYGLEDTEYLDVYLPGAPVSELPWEYMDWVGMTHFGCYFSDTFVRDIPEKMTFAGLYNPVAQEGFFSDSLVETNCIYLTNRAKLPGLQCEKREIHEDGSYYVEDMDRLGRIRVINMSFRSPDSLVMNEEPEAFVRMCVGEMLPDETAEDLYFFGRDDEDWMGKRLFINGDSNLYAFWKTGGNEDTREWRARMLQKDGYIFVYAISASDYEERFKGEALTFYLQSLTFSGSPEGLSSASGDGAARSTYAEVRANAKGDRLEADEVDWISSGDEELMAKYGIDEDDMTDDYAIGGADGDFRTYELSENCPVYVQYPEDGFHALLPREQLKDYCAKYSDARLMVLVLDDEDKVTFMYEPYTP